MWPRSISVRLALMFGCVTAFVSLLASAGLFVQQSAEFERHSREEIHGRFVILKQPLTYSSTEADLDRLSAKFADFSAINPGLLFIVDSPVPRFRIGPDRATMMHFTRAPNGGGVVHVNGRTYTSFAGNIPPNGRRPNVRFIIALDQTPLKSARQRLALSIIAAAVLTIVISSLLGWWIARRSLAPADRLSEEARLLGEGNLTRRLATDSLPWELEGLVISFNAALDRVQRSYQRLSDFNADVAHELRTPLTNLMGETELALARDRTPEELVEVLRSNLEELNRLRATINDMLFLARADTGETLSNLVRVELADECIRTAAFMEVLFEEAATTLSIEGRAYCWIERALFGRAIANLLDNAIAHGSSPGSVVIKIEASADEAAISVTNNGALIAETALPRIFDRFYCADPARRSDGHPHGLGLAIVKAVARLHRGRVFAFNGPDSVTVGFTVSPTGAMTAPNHIQPAVAEPHWRNGGHLTADDGHAFK